MILLPKYKIELIPLHGNIRSMLIWAEIDD